MKVREIEGVERYKMLLSTMKGRPFREENKAYDTIVEAMCKVYGEKKYNALQWFFTNTSKALRNGYRGFSVRLKADYWSGNICGIGARQVKSVLDNLETDGYITIFLGNKDTRAEWLSFPTIIRFEPKLLALFDNEQVSLHVAKGCLLEYVVVKDRKTKEQIFTENTEEFLKMVSKMNDYNQSLSSVQIEFMGEPLPLVEYKRSFSGDLFHGGRLFVHGGGIQLLPEEYRLEHITINGEKIIELDYKANHPYMLYSLYLDENKGISELITEDFDPYNADSSFLQVDTIAIAKHKMKHTLTKYDPVRNLYKRALLLSINCVDFAQTKRTLGNELFKDNLREEKDREFFGIIKPDTGKIIQALADHNYVIEKEFYNDRGIWLQNLDSEIALRVIDLMIQSGEVALCYHDSFCCRESIVDLLYAAMQQAWKEVLGSDKYCKISKK
jgi:hypothetical protein